MAKKKINHLGILNKKPDCCDCESKDPCVAIGASLGGIYIVIVALFLIFAKQSANLLVPIIGFFTILGIFLGAFATKQKKKK